MGSTFRPAARLFARGKKQEGGQAIIMFALLLVPLLLMLALAVDLGIAYAEKRQAQNVADSGALAATQIIGQRIQANGNFSGSDAQICGALNDVALKTSGGSSGGYSIGACGAVGGDRTKIAAQYVDVDGNPFSPPAIVGGGDYPNARGVDLLPTRSVSTNFAKVVNINSLDVGAHSKAVIGVVTEMSDSTPLFVPFLAWQDADQGAACNGRDAFGNPTERGCMMENAPIVFHATKWANCNGGGHECTFNQDAWDVSGTPGTYNITDNSFKGLVRSDSGRYVADATGYHVYTKGGNKGSDPAYDKAQQIWDNAQATGTKPIIIVAVITAGRDGGSNGKYDLIITRFVAVEMKVNPATAGDTFWGSITKLDVPIDGATIGGGTPPSGTPAILSRKFLQ
jgi:hypothetical protein